jgi:hypothetical protein
LALEAAREMEGVENDEVVRLEDLFHLYGGEPMSRLYRDDRAEFARRFQRGLQVTVRL